MKDRPNRSCLSSDRQGWSTSGGLSMVGMKSRVSGKSTLGNCSLLSLKICSNLQTSTRLGQLNKDLFESRSCLYFWSRLHLLWDRIGRLGTTGSLIQRQLSQ